MTRTEAIASATATVDTRPYANAADVRLALMVDELLAGKLAPAAALAQRRGRPVLTGEHHTAPVEVRGVEELRAKLAR